MLLHALCTEIGTRRQLCVPPGAAGHSPTPSPTSAPCRAEPEGQRGAAGGTGGALGARLQPPTPPNKHGQRCTFNPFYWIFHRQKGAERRPRLSPAPGLPGRGGLGRGGGRCSLSSRWGWGWARTPDPARPPASSTGSPTAQTLATTLLYPTHIDGHRGDRGGSGGGRAAPSAPGPGGGRGAVQRRTVLKGAAPGRAERTLGTRGTV